MARRLLRKLWGSSGGKVGRVTCTNKLATSGCYGPDASNGQSNISLIFWDPHGQHPGMRLEGAMCDTYIVPARRSPRHLLRSLLPSFLYPSTTSALTTICSHNGTSRLSPQEAGGGGGQGCGPGAPQGEVDGVEEHAHAVLLRRDPLRLLCDDWIRWVSNASRDTLPGMYN